MREKIIEATLRIFETIDFQVSVNADQEKLRGLATALYRFCLRVPWLIFMTHTLYREIMQLIGSLQV